MDGVLNLLVTVLQGGDETLAAARLRVNQIYFHYLFNYYPHIYQQ